MANEFLTSERISKAAIALLTRTLVLPMTVTRLDASEFSGPSGGATIVRVRQPQDGNIQSGPGGTINYDAIEEVEVRVELEHVYKGINITDQDLTLTLENYVRQVTEIQVDAVSSTAEDQLASVMNDLDADESIDLTDAGEVEDGVLQANEYLNERNVPSGGRWLAVSPKAERYILKHFKDSFVHTTDSDSALRKAIIGDLFGFKVVRANKLDSGTAVAYHSSAFVWANKAPKVPSGANSSSVASSQGVNLRHVNGFNMGTATDQDLISTFAGASLVEDENDPATPPAFRPRSFKFDDQG